jgi:hypothetical protein
MCWASNYTRDKNSDLEISLDEDVYEVLQNSAVNDSLE